MYLVKLQKKCKKANLGKYGRMREQFLKEHRKGLFQLLIMNEELIEHLMNINNKAEEQVDLLITQLAKEENVDEHLKETNQLEWVQRMNNIRNRAEEFVIAKLIYV